MIRVFIPKDKGRIKSDIRGFWQSDNGKVYYDYLKLKNYAIPDKKALIKKLKALKKYYNQEAIAYIINDVLDIYYSNGNTEVLKNRITKTISKDNRKELKAYIKLWLKKYRGVTIYIDKDNYILEAYYQ